MYAVFKRNGKNIKIDLDSSPIVTIDENFVGDDGAIQYTVSVTTSKGVWSEKFDEYDDAKLSVLDFSEAGVEIEITLLSEALDDDSFDAIDEEDALAHIDVDYDLNDEFHDDFEETSFGELDE